MIATEKRLQEIKRKKARIRDTILKALGGTALMSSVWFEVWKCGDQREMPEERANEILNDWLENEDGDIAIAINHLVNMLARGE